MSPQRPKMRSGRGLPRLTPPKKRLVALVLAVALALTFAGLALGQGLGGGSLPAPQEPTDPVAEVDGVDNGVVTLQEFEQSVQQTAEQQGLKKPPSPDDPSYEQIRDQAISNLLLPIWILGEGESQGIEPSDEEIDERLSEIKEQGFENDKEFRRFVERQGFCTEEELAEGEPEQCERVRREVRVQVIAEDLQRSVLPADQEAALSDVPRSDVEAFYDQNIAQYRTPETRDVRLIQTNKAEQAQEAFQKLQQDDSDKTWKQVAKEYSQDAASKERGGLLEGVVEGQSPGGPQFDERVFSAAEGELVGPFETDNGFYVVQVQKINPAETTPLSDVEQQIRQQLAATQQQALAQDFEQDFFAKWKQRTVCAEGYITDDCRNFTPPDPCPAEQEEAGTCPPPVVSTRPVAPGQAGLLTAAGATRAPQGPYQPAPEAPPGLPGGGTIPIGPEGVPQVPGAPPPGAVPPGAAPPGAPPPGAPPPGGAPPPPPPPAP